MIQRSAVSPPYTLSQPLNPGAGRRSIAVEQPRLASRQTSQETLDRPLDPPVRRLTLVLTVGVNDEWIQHIRSGRSVSDEPESSPSASFHIAAAHPVLPQLVARPRDSAGMTGAPRVCENRLIGPFQVFAHMTVSSGKLSQDLLKGGAGGVVYLDRHWVCRRRSTSDTVTSVNCCRSGSNPQASVSSRSSSSSSSFSRRRNHRHARTR